MLVRKIKDIFTKKTAEKKELMARPNNAPQPGNHRNTLSNRYRGGARRNFTGSSGGSSSPSSAGSAEELSDHEQRLPSSDTVNTEDIILSGSSDMTIKVRGF